MRVVCLRPHASHIACGLPLLTFSACAWRRSQKNQGKQKKRKRSSEEEVDFLASDLEDIKDLMDLDEDKGLSAARESQEATHQKTLEALSFLQVI